MEEDQDEGFLRVSRLNRTYKSLFPIKTAILLLRDSEFGVVVILQWVERWHWDYVIQ